MIKIYLEVIYEIVKAISSIACIIVIGVLIFGGACYLILGDYMYSIALSTLAIALRALQFNFDDINHSHRIVPKLSYGKE